MRAVVTPDDLKRGDLADIGWFPAQLVKYNEEPAGNDAKNPGSTNCWFTWKILEGPSAGKEVRNLINETALGFGKAFYAAIGLPKNQAGGYDVSTELFQSLVSKKLTIYVGRVKGKNNKEYSSIEDFRPMS